MSLARKHRETISVQSASAADPVETGGLDTPMPITAGFVRPSLARRHVERIAASAATPATPNPESDPGTPEERAARQIALRMVADLRRLKEIQSIEKKIAAKRDMLPEYAAWIDGMLSGNAIAPGIADDVLPTIMVWSIDTGDWNRALELAAFVLEHDVALPSRYERTAPTLIAEEIAEAAQKALNAGEAFDLDVLTHVELLTEGRDMPDEVRAKLFKAIGVEQQRQFEAIAPTDATYAIRGSEALAALKRARELNPRVGVADRLKRLWKALAPTKDTTSAGQAG